MWFLMQSFLLKINWSAHCIIPGIFKKYFHQYIPNSKMEVFFKDYLSIVIQTTTYTEADLNPLTIIVPRKYLQEINILFEFRDVIVRLASIEQANIKKQISYKDKAFRQVYSREVNFEFEKSVTRLKMEPINPKLKKMGRICL